MKIKNMKKKETKVVMTEMFMAKAGNDFTRCFHGTIKREKDVEGNPVVRSRIKVNQGYILAIAEDQWVLGTKLDELVVLILDKKMHSNKGIFFNHNNFENSLN
jgi:hypothetical protein